MVRPKINRVVRKVPEVTYFKPRGIPLSDLGEINLTIEEIESLRLKHYQDLNQTKCAEKMEISQSTFSRILESAHKKLASAIIDGKAIKIMGGNYHIKKPFIGYGCLACKEEWEAINESTILDVDELTQETIDSFLPLHPEEDVSCPKCKSSKIYRLTKNIIIEQA